MDIKVMSMKIYSSLLVLLFSVVTMNTYAQYAITGKILDKEKLFPLTEVNIVLTGIKDTTENHYALSGDDGSFKLSNLKNQTYRLRAIYIGYKKLDETIEIKSKTQDIGSLLMKRQNVVSALRRDVTFVGNALVAVVFIGFASLAVAAALFDLVSMRH